MRVNWEVTNKCNYHCKYCYNQTKKTDFKINKFYILYLFETLNELRGDNKISFTLTGGEPTTLSFMIYIVKKAFDYYGDNLDYINFITNGSRCTSYFSNFLGYPKDKFFVRYSIHPFYWCDDKKEVLEYLIKNKVPLKISVLFDTNNREQIPDIIKFLDQFELNEYFQPSLRKIFGCDSVKYTAADFEFLKEINEKWRQEEKITNTSVNKFKGKYCAFGKDLLVINSDLTFSSSYCPLSKTHNTPILFLDKDQIKEKITEVIKCKCGCCEIPTNLLIPKFDTKEEAINYLKK